MTLPEKALFTIEEAGAQLALSRASVYRLLDEGQLRRVYPRPRAARITRESLAAQSGEVAQAARERKQVRKEQRRGGLLGRWGLDGLIGRGTRG